MSLDTHLMGLFRGQRALRAKLPFLVCASVITLTSDISDIKRRDGPLVVTEEAGHSSSGLTDHDVSGKTHRMQKKSLGITVCTEIVVVFFLSVLFQEKRNARRDKQ